MDDFFRKDTKDGFTMKLWRGERKCLLGFDVENPEPDFVGFAIECKEPGANDFHPLLNRIAFAYDSPVEVAVTGARKFDSRRSPFQKFRWVHFPFDPKPGAYTYRATKMHMPSDASPVPGTAIELPISLDPVTYAGFVDIGFTRGFASSQAFIDKFPPDADINAIGKTIIPTKADLGLKFKKLDSDIYDWMGFEAYDLLMGFLKEAIDDEAIQVDFFAYDLNEPDVVAKLEQLGPRLRAIVDDSAKKDESGEPSGHGASASAESQAARRLQKSAGTGNVKRTHFKGLQHNKVLIAKRNGSPFKVFAGSMNFSFRGIYIQSNNVFVFSDPDIAALYEQAFEAAFQDPATFSSSELASKWHVVQGEGRPAVHLCFSPHKSTDIP